MAAMIWDNESQAFKEADVPMKYDPTAESWTGTTGMAWDNEAQAWTEKWGAQVSAYVYGAVSETITIRKNGIVVATVQTDLTGKSTKQITLSDGTYTLTGSVSGWTEEQTVDSSTTKFRAMPEKSIYWYGYQDKSITGGFVQGYAVNSCSFQETTHSVNITHDGSDANYHVCTNNLINLNGYTCVKGILNVESVNNSYPTNQCIALEKDNTCSQNYGISNFAPIGMHDVLIMIPSSVMSACIGYSGTGSVKICSLWLE